MEKIRVHYAEAEVGSPILIPDSFNDGWCLCPRYWTDEAFEKNIPAWPDDRVWRRFEDLRYWQPGDRFLYQWYLTGRSTEWFLYAERHKYHYAIGHDDDDEFIPEMRRARVALCAGGSLPPNYKFREIDILELGDTFDYNAAIAKGE